MPAKRRPFKQTELEHEARFILEELFSAWFDDEVGFEVEPDDGAADFRVRLGSTSLLLELKASATASVVDGAIQQVKRVAGRREVPVVVVPFMGEVGRRLCATAGVSWVDLSGNADIRAPRLRVVIDGRPNRYVKLGRPATPFAPKSSRLSRWLLIDPHQFYSQRELALKTEIDAGRISRLVARLKDLGLVKLDDVGRVALADRRLMLDAWSEDYEFQQHHIIRGHLPARSGQEAAGVLGRELERLEIQHAFTGLAAAWSYTHFANYRLSTVYVLDAPSMEQLRKIDFVAQDKGSNVWLVLPNDPGVFVAAGRRDDLEVVHPVQTLLDLKGHPERAPEAAAELREQILKGEFDG